MKVKVSVILPIFNGENFVKESLKSILSQRFKDFEVIVIDDGSTDGTLRILKGFKDKRIRIFQNKKNLGVAKSLNIGLGKARGEYIARADVDDVNEKDRFKKQVKFLNEHPDYSLVGSRMILIDEKGQGLEEKKIRRGYTQLPLTDKDIKNEIFRRNPISHPSVMMRRESVLRAGGYQEELNGVEDYNLWFRLMRLGKFENLAEPLIKRRITGKVVTIKNHFKVEMLAIIVRIKNLPIIRNIGLDVLLGFFTFILYRFWMVWMLFNGRNIPPEPDDSYFYLAAANRLWGVDSFESFRLILYSTWLNLIKWVTHLDWEKTYYLNFYIGTVLMFLVLIFLLRKMEKNLFMRMVLITFIGLFTGSGAYHGFYWVVPSFYQLMIFFALLTLVLIPSRVNQVWLVVFTALFIFIHPSSPLYFGCFILVPLITSVVKRNWLRVQVKKGVAVGIWGFLFLVIYILLSSRFPQAQSPESPLFIIRDLGQIFQGGLNPISWDIIWHEYFRLIFLNVLTILGMIFCLSMTFYLKKLEVLFTYIVLLLTVLFSAFIPYGYRTLEFIWPFTFIIFGYGLIGLFTLLREKYKTALTLSALGMIGFYILATGLNVAWIASVNSASDYTWDRNCVSELKSVAGEKPIYFYSKVGYYAFQTYGFPDEMILVPNQNYKLILGDKILTNTNASPKVTKLNPLSLLLANKITRDGKSLGFFPVSTQNYWEFPILNDKSSNLKKILDCDFFQAEVVE